MRLSDRGRASRRRYGSPSVAGPRSFWRAYEAGAPFPASTLPPSHPPGITARLHQRYPAELPTYLDKGLRPLMNVSAFMDAKYVYRPPLDYYNDETEDYFPLNMVQFAIALTAQFRKWAIPMYILSFDPFGTEAFALGYFGDQRLLEQEQILLAIEAVGSDMARRRHLTVQWYKPLIWSLESETEEND